MDAVLRACTGRRAVKAPQGRGGVPIHTLVSLRAVSSSLVCLDRFGWLACLSHLACTGDPQLLTLSKRSLCVLSLAASLFATALLLSLWYLVDLQHCCMTACIIVSPVVCRFAVLLLGCVSHCMAQLLDCGLLP